MLAPRRSPRRPKLCRRSARRSTISRHSSGIGAMVASRQRLESKGPPPSRHMRGMEPMLRCTTGRGRQAPRRKHSIPSRRPLDKCPILNFKAIASCESQHAGADFVPRIRLREHQASSRVRVFGLEIEMIPQSWCSSREITNSEKRARQTRFPAVLVEMRRTSASLDHTGTDPEKPHDPDQRYQIHPLLGGHQPWEPIARSSRPRSVVFA
jgi:hypothetical protein